MTVVVGLVGAAGYGASSLAGRSIRLAALPPVLASTAVLAALRLSALSPLKSFSLSVSLRLSVVAWLRLSAVA